MIKKAVIFTAILSAVILSVNVQVLISQEKLEHPVIKSMPGSTLKERFAKKENFSTETFRIKVDGATQNVEKKGQYWNLSYEFLSPDGSVDRSRAVAEVIENYAAATLEKGGQVLNRGSNYLVFSVPREDGGMSWAKVNGSLGTYGLIIIDEKPLERVLSFGAEELKKALDSDGRVAVYGINFAIDKADLQLGAENVIAEFVKLMNLYPELKIEIQGHTDNTGSAEHNLDLSNRRAETVKKYMQLFGIDSTRSVAKGYGMTMPVADNGTEDGRAQNRRVELVKIK